jgi:hypothetical protein
VQNPTCYFVTVQASNGELLVEISLPENYHLTKGANSRFDITTEQPGAIAFEPCTGSFDEIDGRAVARVQFRRSAGASANLSSKVYYCLDGGVCLYQEVVFSLPFSAEACRGKAGLSLISQVQVAKWSSLSDF